ncbi:helix-turn-helix domain-containing protein (plasmid) [Pseudarthrobacter sp. P1]|uniref:helix-turn-helix domain-containing protein n=1 Tax=Pseudarthrobacter sp. P1 TaxID=3418418 RepID=UPI003CF51F8C
MHSTSNRTCSATTSATLRATVMTGSRGSGGRQSTRPLQRFLHPIDAASQCHNPTGPNPRYRSDHHTTRRAGAKPRIALRSSKEVWTAGAWRRILGGGGPCHGHTPPLPVRGVKRGEERRIRRLAGARHAPAGWILRARMVTGSWAGNPVSTIAADLGCHTKTVRERLHRFNAEGLDGLGDKPISGRPPRLGEDERSRIIALAGQPPPGRLVRDSAGELAAAQETGPGNRPAGVDPGHPHRGPCRRYRGAPQPGPLRSCPPRACAGAAPGPGSGARTGGFVPKGHGSSGPAPARPTIPCPREPGR